MVLELGFGVFMEFIRVEYVGCWILCLLFGMFVIVGKDIEAVLMLS